MSYRLAVLGDPIEHSLSPEIHSAALEALGLDGVYARVRADREILGKRIADIRSGDMEGINVTMPLKSAAAQLVDEVTPRAFAAGSVNTVSRVEGRTIGETTDALAMEEYLAARWPHHPLYVLGAGGAAAAAGIAAGHRVVYVASRNARRAADLADRLVDASAVPWGVPVAGAVVINATPLGANGEDLPDGILEAAEGLIDLAYGPSITPAMSRARQIGMSTVDGVEFLVAQAAHSFRVWTGVEPPTEVMLEAARQAVIERNT